ncbi:MAG: SagB/ThcOx family dehydrogenase [Bacteroidales bacterium]|nr:SagB/ThcOx family dehydrogenase [Bacteroidales bacterium]
MKKIFDLLFVSLFVIVGFVSCDSKKEDTSIAEDNSGYSISTEIQDSIVLLPNSKTLSVDIMEALSARRTERAFSNDNLTNQQIADLLWAANGVNRVEDGKRTAPSARNAQEIDVYLFTPVAIYRYEAVSHSLKLVKEGDFRTSAGTQPFYAAASVAISLVVDFGKMEGFDEEAKAFYSATDVGYVSQNIYLYCAAENLGTVVCGSVDREAVANLLGIQNGKVLLSHAIGVLN